MLTDKTGMNFVNEQFYELTGYARVPTDQSGWFDLVADEDRERVKENWDSMMNGDKSHAAQFRLKKTWV
jgi:PAS domain-containing protein